MKVWAASAHSWLMRRPSSARAMKSMGGHLGDATGDGLPAAPGFTDIYEAWFHHVARWVHAFGAPPGDIEDIAQEVFLVVRRRLGAFDGRNLAGWLYRIAQLTVRDCNRRAWVRHLFSRDRDLDLDELPHVQQGPAASLEKKQERQLLARVLARISEKRRMTFVLFEIEGYTCEEIARIQDIPIGTVWTRLHHARKDFLALVAELRAREEREERKENDR